MKKIGGSQQEVVILNNPWEQWKASNQDKCPVWWMHSKHGQGQGFCKDCGNLTSTMEVIPSETVKKKVKGKMVDIARQEKIFHCASYTRQDIAWSPNYPACSIKQAIISPKKGG